MPAFERVYSDDQRDAVALAVLDRGIKPAREVARLAAAGELTLRGKPMAAFNVPLASVRDMTRQERKRRAGDAKSALADIPPRDAIEALRRRLVSFADTELQRMERAQKKGAEADIERFRAIIRAVRECAALPAHGEGPTPRPGQGPKAQRVNAVTRGGPVAPILAAHRATSGQTAPEAQASEGGQQGLSPTGASKEKAGTEGHEREDEAPKDRDDNEPGVFVAERVAALQR